MTPTNPTADELQEALEMAGRWEGEESRLTLSPAENALRAVITLAAAYRLERAAREKAKGIHRAFCDIVAVREREALAKLAQVEKERDEIELARKNVTQHSADLAKHLTDAGEEVSALRSRITELEARDGIIYVAPSEKKL